MCGIVCVLNSSLEGEALNTKVSKLSKLLRHRGPDEHDLYTRGNCTLAHERLSIVDVAHGRQPLFSEDRSIILVCNGEIYNHVDLHQKIKTKRKFSTNSDSEIILHLYQDYQPIEFLNMLDGMFAFVIMGGPAGFLAARDPIGIKPLLYGYGEDGSIWFASELKAIQSEVKKVLTFPMGHYWTPEDGFVRYFFPTWWNEARVPTNPADCALIASTFEKAVQKRLMADVEVGVFLSGGLDSSLVAAVANKHIKKLHSFSVGIESIEKSPDLQNARKVAAYLGTNHHERIFTIEEGLKAVEKVIYHMETYDAASIRSGCGMYLLCEMISKYVKVCISGEGSDEVFAGYLYFGEATSPEQLQAECVRKIKKLNSIQLQFNDRLGMAHGVEVRVPYLDKDLLELCLNIDPRDKYHSKEKIEKWILRNAFQGAIPDDVLWRQKEHFGDGIGYSWIDGLKAMATNAVSDEQFAKAKEIFPIDTPSTKEQFYYREIFHKLFPGDKAVGTVEKWLPWSRPTVDPSPRFHATSHSSAQGSDSPQAEVKSELIPESLTKLPNHLTHSVDKYTIKHLVEAAGLRSKSLLSIQELSTSNIYALFSLSELLQKQKPEVLKKTLSGTTFSLLFFQESTRTRNGFAAAIQRLGGDCLIESNPKVDSASAKGEVLLDTLKTHGCYSHCLVLRHASATEAKEAAEEAFQYNCIPIINAGFGDWEHPTQALVDVYTFWLTFGELEGKKLCIAGPHLTDSRASHSLAFAVAPYKMEITIASPKDGAFKKSDIEELKKLGAKVTEVYDQTRSEFETLLREQDVVYLPGSCVVETNTNAAKEYKDQSANYYLDARFVDRVSVERGRRLFVHHPLSRRPAEMDFNIDKTESELYFKALKYSVPLRMAIVLSIMSGFCSLEGV